jgi:hypothetical protein
MLFQGLAGMDCPFCEAVIMHVRWHTPLVLAPSNAKIGRIKRNAVQAAYWAYGSAGAPLTDYLMTKEGQPYIRTWSALEIQRADQHVTENPMVP